MVGWDEMEWGGCGCWRIGAALMRQCDFGPLDTLLILPILSNLSHCVLTVTAYDLHRQV